MKELKRKLKRALTPYHIAITICLIVLITSLCIAIVFRATAIEFILFLILPMLSNLILSFGGTYINLLLPKLTWENEAQVVKQGMSVLVTMLIGFVITLIPVVFTLCGLSITLSGLISLGAYLLIFILTLILLFVDGKKKFEIRKNDRNFKTEDTVKLREFKDGKYTGNYVKAIIDYIFYGGSFGLEEGYCIFSISVYEYGKE